MGIDHFALLSGQYDWLTDVSKLPKRNLDKLPNFAYSLALVKFRKDDVDENEEALSSLISAIIKFPGVIPLLSEKLNIQISAEDKAKLLSFDDAGKPLQI